jgi:hypothetical protein
MIPELTPLEIERFYSKMRVAGCGMLWTGPVNNHGYGRFQIYRSGKRIRVLAHRLSYFLATGEDPGTGKIRHGCDAPPCCTPDCLEPGTQAENIHDAIARGRFNPSGLEAGHEAQRARIEVRIQSGLKVCSVCKQTLPLGDFVASRGKPDGHDCRCKECTNRLRREARRSDAA